MAGGEGSYLNELLYLISDKCDQFETDLGHRRPHVFLKNYKVEKFDDIQC